MKKFEKWSFVLIVIVCISMEIFECRFIILRKFSSNCVNLGDYQLSLGSDYYIEKSQKGLEIIDTKSTSLVALIRVIDEMAELTVAKISLKSGNLKERKFGSDIRVYEGIANNTKERGNLYENIPFIVEVIGVGKSESCILIQYLGEVSRKDRLLSETLRSLENSRDKMVPKLDK
ncbi:MAG: hypothetical protein GXO69_00935 [Acidobacteria bacterium]|nr:hypothetical protein [Acidobacteriota bacterium]